MIGRAIAGGLPAAVAASIRLNAGVNMAGWYWSTPSSSHRPASASWRARRASIRTAGTRVPSSGRTRHGDRLLTAATSLMGISSLIPPPRCHHYAAAAWPGPTLAP
jgi:hypothetical protein